MTNNETKVVLDEDEEAALKAQAKHNTAIADHQVEILKLIQRLKKLGGSQDYSMTILAVLKAFGPTVSLATFAPVLPDAVLLSEARDRLEKEGLIRVTAVKNRKFLNLVAAA